MDVSSLPDILNNFVQAGETALPVLKPIIQQALENAQDISAAFGSDSPFSLGEKLYHGGKLVAFSGLLLLSASTLSIEGAIPSGFVVGEELLSLDKTGEQVRALHDKRQFDLL